MDLTIKPLTSELGKNFTEYLEEISFDHAPHWATCYCRFYHHNGSLDEWTCRSGEANREEALFEIDRGNMKGYLAFDGKQCIGWLNANDLRQYKRFEDYEKPFPEDTKAGCVICFVIHPDYRRKGIAKSLLKRAVDDFKRQGYDGVLALPIDGIDKPEMQYRGTLNMYTSLGFKLQSKEENVNIMWLEFNKNG